MIRRFSVLPVAVVLICMLTACRDDLNSTLPVTIS